MLYTLLSSFGCSSQNNTNKPSSVDRYPAVAGQFYPSDKDTLTSTLKSLFDKALPKSTQNVFAIISPHAGYIYSGQVAASAFNQIDTDKEYETIFVIGASHRYLFNGASVYNKGNFITPLGIVEVDTVLANKLFNSDKVFQQNADYHLLDHCIEVQLPFLQYHLKNKFKIVPILIGTSSQDLCKKIAIGLKPYITDKNLFIISSDFSHYPKNSDAITNDKATAEAITKNSSIELIKIINSNFDKKIPKLETSLCGFDAVVTMLYMTEKMKDISVVPIEYKNSSDATKDSSSVVGYWAMAFTSKDKFKTDGQKTDFLLSEKDKSDLLKIARNTLNSYIKDGKMLKIDTSDFSKTIKQNCGAFVTLKINGELRGCIGMFMPDKPLYLVVRDMAISSSTQDTRFNRVKVEELKKINIEISVLSPFKKITSSDEIILGKHGIYMIKNGVSGTFLPQVATETGWSKDEFLGHCARDKAGIGWDGWKTADIYTYTAVVFGE